MRLRFIAVLMLFLFIVSVSGCVVLQSTYTKKEEEANLLAEKSAALEQNNKNLMADKEKLLAENDTLKKQTVQQEEQLRKQAEAIALQDKKQADMVHELDTMKAQLNRGEETLADQPAAARKSGQAMRLKVLSGDGRIASARTMAKKINRLGYKVESTGMADSKNYPANTVYFAKAYQKQAKALAAKLGRDTILKPLSWKSVFDLIVVTGG